MKYLLTGANGFLGRFINDELKAAGHEVITVGRGENAQIKANFGSGKSFQVPSDMEIVVHAAGKAHTVPRSPEEKKAFYDVNLNGTKEVLESIEQSLCTNLKLIIFISSVGVYGVSEGKNIPENAPLSGTEPYADSKIKAEKYLSRWCLERNVPYLILRLPLITGPNPPGNLGKMLSAMKSGKYFRLGSGAARKSMVRAKDVGTLIAHSPIITGVYNLTDGQDPSFAELEDALVKAGGLRKVRSLPLSVIKLMAKVGDVMQMLLGKSPITSDMVKKITSDLTFSDEAARKDLNWNPEPVLAHADEIVK